MLTPKTKRNISRIIPIGLIWSFFSVVYTLVERGIIGDLDIYPATGNPYNFQENIILTPLTALIAGSLVGTIDVLYLSKRFANQSLRRKILIKTAIYVTAMLTFLIITAALSNAVRLQTNILDNRVLQNVWIFLSDFSFWSSAILVAAIIGVSLFYSEVSENLGQGVLKNFFTGKYHNPIEEERVFMFLDMKSSTTIAEELGHVKYFELLREYYDDISEPTIDFLGEIYQYVGDEIVISWPSANGLKDSNCIKCFFAMRDALKDKEQKYLEKFGVAPTFKAGIHIGEVTTGEIGLLKKDIIFTGDVLNTTARIQGLCNSYKVDLLVSEDLLNRLNVKSGYEIKFLGEIELRGKDEMVKLTSISETARS